jgi:hypothetical protein
LRALQDTNEVLFYRLVLDRPCCHRWRAHPGYWGPGRRRDGHLHWQALTLQRHRWNSSDANVCRSLWMSAPRIQTGRMLLRFRGFVSPANGSRVE